MELRLSARVGESGGLSIEDSDSVLEEEAEEEDVELQEGGEGGKEEEEVLEEDEEELVRVSCVREDE